MDFNTENKLFDWARGFVVDLDKNTGLSPQIETGARYLSQMKGAFHDEEAEKALLAAGDPVIYEFHRNQSRGTKGDLIFGCSIIQPGKVGDEYHMTKGHFHSPADICEVYYCIGGEGYMMLENEAGDWSCLALHDCQVCYVPKGYAHRLICTGDTPFVVFFVNHAECGQNYGAIETKGFHKLLVERDGSPAIIDNPKWAE